MSEILIIQADSSVSVDFEVQVFDYSALIDPDIKVVFWNTVTGVGQTETWVDGELIVEEIQDFTPWQPIYVQYDLNKTLIVTAIQFNLTEVEITYASSDSEIKTTAECVADSITYTELPLQDAKDLKYGDVTQAAVDIVNEIFNDTTEAETTRSRSTVNFKWNSLNSKATLTGDEDDTITFFNLLFTHLETLSAETITINAEIDALLTVQGIADYVIDFTSTPVGLLDTNDSDVVYIRNASI